MADLTVSFISWPATVGPDTLWRQWRRLPPCPLVIALVPLKYSCRCLHFPHRLPFTKEKMPWCPYPFKNEAYRPAESSILLKMIRAYRLNSWVLHLVLPQTSLDYTPTMRNFKSHVQSIIKSILSLKIIKMCADLPDWLVEADCMRDFSRGITGITTWTWYKKKKQCKQATK